MLRSDKHFEHAKLPSRKPFTKLLPQPNKKTSAYKDDHLQDVTADPVSNY